MDVQDFLFKFDEFDEPDVRLDWLDSILKDAERMCPVDVWGDPEQDDQSVRNEAIANLAAHTYACRLEQKARMVAMATGAASGTAPQPIAIESDLKTTGYGACFVRLRDEHIIMTGFVP